MLRLLGSLLLRLWRICVTRWSLATIASCNSSGRSKCLLLSGLLSDWFFNDIVSLQLSAFCSILDLCYCCCGRYFSRLLHSQDRNSMVLTCGSLSLLIAVASASLLRPATLSLGTSGVTGLDDPSDFWMAYVLVVCLSVYDIRARLKDTWKLHQRLTRALLCQKLVAGRIQHLYNGTPSRLPRRHYLTRLARLEASADLERSCKAYAAQLQLLQG